MIINESKFGLKGLHYLAQGNALVLNVEVNFALKGQYL